MYKYCVFSVPRARVSSAPWRIFAGRISIFDYWVDWTSFSAGHNSDKSNDFIEGALGHTFMKINLWLSLTLPKETRLCTEIVENKQNKNILIILENTTKRCRLSQRNDFYGNVKSAQTRENGYDGRPDRRWWDSLHRGRAQCQERSKNT